MLRFLPSYQAVESMRQGHPPAEAARIALQRIIVHYPKFEGAVITVSKDGIVGKFKEFLPTADASADQNDDFIAPLTLSSTVSPCCQ